MTAEHDLAEKGRAIVDATLYMVLATADRDGRPWASPVYFAPSSYRRNRTASDHQGCDTHSSATAGPPWCRNVAIDSDDSVPTYAGSVAARYRLAATCAPASQPTRSPNR